MTPRSRQEALDSVRERLGAQSAHKAGLEKVDRAAVDRTIFEASQGSAFFQRELQKDASTEQRIATLRARMQQLQTQDQAAALRAADRLVADLEAARDLSQTVVHLDMDAFYAAVHERDDPRLRTIPLGVGTGVLCTANYAARTFGVRSAMPAHIARRLCPHITLVELDFQKYRDAAAEVRAVLAEFDVQVCPVGLDEAYLLLPEGSAATAAATVEAIRARVLEKTRLSCSAGIAPNRMLAKICSDMKKPNGQFEVAPDRDAVLGFIQPLSVRRVPGIGKVGEKVLRGLGWETCGDVVAARALLVKLFSEKHASFLLRASLGLGAPFADPDEDWVRKSLSVERTFAALKGAAALHAKLDELAEQLAVRMVAKGVSGRLVTLRIKLDDFSVLTRASTAPLPVADAAGVLATARGILDRELWRAPALSVRLLGIRLSQLVPRDEALADAAGQRTVLELFASGGSEASSSTGDLTMVECPVCGATLQDSEASGFAVLNRHLDTCVDSTAGKTTKSGRAAPRRGERPSAKGSLSSWLQRPG